MPTCVFCKRDGLPPIPTMAGVAVAHATDAGEPCNEGTTPEMHGQSLADFPHEELLDEDSLWDLPPEPEKKKRKR